MHEIRYIRYEIHLFCKFIILQYIFLKYQKSMHWHCLASYFLDVLELARPPRFSTHYAMSLCNVLSRDLLSSEYRKHAPWLARKGEVRGVFCGFIIWSVLWLSHFVLFSMSWYFQPIRAIFDRDIMRAYGNNISEMICHILVMWCCQQNSV